MSRTQWILAVLLGSQALLLLLVASPWSSGSGSAPAAALLPELQSFVPARIEISGGEEKLALARDEGTWRIEQAGGYPVDETKIEALLDKLEKAEVRRPVVRSSRYHEALRVTPEEHERDLRIWDGESGDPRVELFVGSSPNYGVNHVRRADRDEVYEVEGLSPWDMRPEASSWLETRLVDVEPDRVRSLALTNAHGTFELARGEGGRWSLASGGSPGAELDDSSVETFVRSIGSLRLSEPAGRADAAKTKEYGLDQPAGRVDLALEPQEGESASFGLTIGGEVAGDDGRRYARVSGSDFAVILARWDAERVLDKKVADLLASKDEKDAR
jgi:hypothetical protein